MLPVNVRHDWQNLIQSVDFYFSLAVSTGCFDLNKSLKSLWSPIGWIIFGSFSCQFSATSVREWLQPCASITYCDAIDTILCQHVKWTSIWRPTISSVNYEIPFSLRLPSAALHPGRCCGGESALPLGPRLFALHVGAVMRRWRLDESLSSIALCSWWRMRCRSASYHTPGYSLEQIAFFPLPYPRCRRPPSPSPVVWMGDCRTPPPLSPYTPPCRLHPMLSKWPPPSRVAVIRVFTRPLIHDAYGALRGRLIGINSLERYASRSYRGCEAKCEPPSPFCKHVEGTDAMNMFERSSLRQVTCCWGRDRSQSPHIDWMSFVSVLPHFASTMTWFYSSARLNWFDPKEANYFCLAFVLKSLEFH